MVKCEIEKLEVNAEPTLKDAHVACGDCYITYFFTWNISSLIPNKTESVPGYFSAPSLYRCLCLVKGIPQETSGLVLTTCECESSPGLAYANGRLECFPPLWGSSL